MLSVVHTPVSPAVSHGMACTTKTVLQRARINDLKAFSSVKLEIQQNTKGLLTMSRISSTIFQKVRMAAFVHSLRRVIKFNAVTVVEYNEPPNFSPKLQ